MDKELHTLPPPKGAATIRLAINILDKKRYAIAEAFLWAADINRVGDDRGIYRDGEGWKVVRDALAHVIGDEPDASLARELAVVCIQLANHYRSLAINSGGDAPDWPVNTHQIIASELGGLAWALDPAQGSLNEGYREIAMASREHAEHLRDALVALFPMNAGGNDA